jgi:hypothetical protein
VQAVSEDDERTFREAMNDVLAFSSARPVDGGTGAAYVLLGRLRDLREPRRASGR